MASLCLMNSLPVPPSSSHSPKLTETSLPPSPFVLHSNNNHSVSARALKPIVVRGDPPTFVSAPGRRILAVGDLHGDLKQARSALEMAGVLSSDGQDLWTGGETVLIQVGDILDRGEEEIAILSLLRSLDKQAKAKGGAVFQVNGNHETMNVEGDFRYVDSGAFDECNDFLEYVNDSEDGWEETFTGWVDVSERWKEQRTMSNSYWGPWNLVKDSSSSQPTNPTPLQQATTVPSAAAPHPTKVAPAPTRVTRSTLVIAPPFRPPAPATTPPCEAPSKAPSMVSNTSRPKPSKFRPKQKIFRPPAPLFQGQSSTTQVAPPKEVSQRTTPSDPTTREST